MGDGEIRLILRLTGAAAAAIAAYLAACFRKLYLI